MRVTVRKWGNSLALQITSGLAQDARLEDGTEVDLAVADGRLIVQPVIVLDTLVARITPENLPELVFDDAPRRGEVW
jgi:antitoxin MazE